MDTTKLGKIAAELMERLAKEERQDDEIGAVAIVVETRGTREDESGYTVIQVECSDPRYWITRGLLQAGLEVVIDEWDSAQAGGDGED
jgi:hypothetical protein